ncbi:hypothetical protein CONPUDRAFT_134149 [Coniophora puteana RWD-64-598 SS2]|uniref:Pentatricopeptide repeat-containing protein n=1 Tax=Coniophora puteana (strain RWD-64-598) TaxID=741705 RepID=A0A5M3N5X6_CONPW|nr:uncharacterized protein CONPUDRAFT_134149 [Coniophora puteana RWD-64-598 SS2]EIW86793.1 hypothetical protein CONPUDRAFT_134149 [Coniophora puteana RWD-64-598 SS2]
MDRVRSTRSYNAVISFAIQHAAYGSVPGLFRDMQRDGLVANVESWKLGVRLLIRTGRWDEAWSRVTQISKRTQAQSRETSDRLSIPIVVWLELFGSAKYSLLRRTYRYATSGRIPGSTVEGNDASRYLLLMRHFPGVGPTECAQMSPRTVGIIVREMIRIGQSHTAFEVTQAYLKSLPATLSAISSRRTMDLIHLHLASEARKRGLRAHFALRRTLHTLLDSCSAATPTAKTLHLLLRSLRPTKRCGTLANQCLRLYRRRWGPQIESSAVRRRVASLALKEGRLDIAQEMIKRERLASISRACWTSQLHLLGGCVRVKGRTRRLPFRFIRPGWSKDSHRWRALRKRVLILSKTK